MGLYSACGSSGLQVELEFYYIMSGDEGRGPIGTAEAGVPRHDLRELAFC